MLKTDDELEQRIEQWLKDKANWPGLIEAIQPIVRQIASAAIRKHGERQYWVTTELIGEINLRLLSGREFPSGKDRAQFFGYVIKATKHILLEEARKRAAKKRGGRAEHVPIDSISEPAQFRLVKSSTTSVEYLADLATALERLKGFNKEWEFVISARYMAGFSQKQIAEELGVSISTVKERERLGKKFIKMRMAPSIKS